ncbi:membrane-associated phosphatidylinositol transfer protein 2-like isoform X2 [Corythoichthys intestinalis]|uniref:membrane-associated phosphatidylinositol transfer protein 2-like isoform X2 n=1 Tax=Corythoichthys intestinalis TaxID=161448 RepID=UPI0025A66FF5|nr:membrane-associated phosphatidylinositol transfer protein 2-like isoform X2 [Corythoichthys intestinalis]
MLIKEYHIPMPMSVEEYRIAQLYMIQKKSREESCGEGSGVEILKNKPYTDGPGGTGQYTHKVYHIGMHIPGWFRSILPKAALRVEEESWNAYPYTRTRYTCPFVEKFSIDIETYYMGDAGGQQDVFNMSAADKRQRTIDPIDIVSDHIPPHEYKAEEDPRLYKSAKTQRGPLRDDWILEYRENPGLTPIMCAYKLCKVEFRYWGMQSKIERFIHDVGLRKVMVRAHRQAWCWQDEWYGLTMEDIRQLELETQLALARKMAEFCQAQEANGDAPAQERKAEEVAEVAAEAEVPAEAAPEIAARVPDTLRPRGVLVKQWSASSRSSRSSKRGVSPSRHSISEWRMQSIARDSDDSSDEEFFDAQEDFSDGEEVLPKPMAKWNSNDLMDKMEASDTEEHSGELFKDVAVDYDTAAVGERLPEESSSQQPSKIHVLILVLHGGNILDAGGGEPSGKQADVNTIGASFDSVMRVHYPAAVGRLAVRLVPCPNICAEAFSLVSNLSPYGYDESCLSSSQDHIPLAALPLLATSAPQYQEAVTTVVARANQVYADFIKSLDGAAFSGQVCLIGDCVGGILGFDALCSSNQTVNESQNSSRRGSLDQDLLSPAGILNCGQGSASPTLEGSRHLSRSNVDIPRSVSATDDNKKRQLRRKRSDSSAYEPDTIKQHQAFLSSLYSGILRVDGASRRSSSSMVLDGGSPGKLDFEVADFFLFGSPLGLVLALRKTVIPTLDVAQLRPACRQVYNLFHPADPSASRLEPLLERKFHLLPPFNVPRYQRFPLGDGNSTLLADAVQSHGGVFADTSYPSSPVAGSFSGGRRRASELSIASQVSGMVDADVAGNIANTQRQSFSQREKFRLLSGLALSSQNKFSLKSPPKSCQKVKEAQDEKDGEEACDRQSLGSDICLSPGLHVAMCDLVSLDSQAEVEQVAARWWGTKRMDFALYCPDALTAFPTVALPHLFHASYWESTDVVSFLLRQVMRHDNSSILELDGREVSEFTPSKPREKWLRKRTHVKIRNVTANHRVNDAVFTEDGRQTLSGRFMYGPLDMVTLAGEKVDLHIMTQPPSGEWLYFDTEVTNGSGRVSFALPDDKRLGVGVYPVKMVVRGDHTFADSYLTVVPRGTEFVVFSIDGSFAASVSIMGSDPKVRAGAVDVVRHWQDLGYLIIYVTGRPDMQKQRVVAWLSQHNFPHGIVSFCDGLVHDPLRHKANFLKALTEANMKIFAGYGSSKDISVYASINLHPSQIFIVGRPSKKMQHQCQFITEGYASHLSQLEHNQRSRPAKSGSARAVLRKSSFGLGANSDFLRKRNHLLRTISSQPPVTTATGGGHGRPERTQSQSDGDRSASRAHAQGAAQRSMSLAAGCWGRGGPK